MDPIERFVDRRQQSWCIQCGAWIGEVETDEDHVPSKCLLRKPRPAGWEAAKKARLEEVLQRAYEDGVLSEADYRAFRELGRLRNSRAHFRAYKRRTTMIARVTEENALSAEVLAMDARRAVEAMAKIVARQSGRRVVLGSPDE